MHVLMLSDHTDKKHNSKFKIKSQVQPLKPLGCGLCEYAFTAHATSARAVRFPRSRTLKIKTNADQARALKPLGCGLCGYAFTAHATSARAVRFPRSRTLKTICLANRNEVQKKGSHIARQISKKSKKSQEQTALHSSARAELHHRRQKSKGGRTPSLAGKPLLFCFASVVRLCCALPLRTRREVATHPLSTAVFVHSNP
jgi:hypothetical protein